MNGIIRALTAGLLSVSLATHALATSSLAEYRVAEGCPAREQFESQLERRLRLPSDTSGELGIVIEQADGTFVGHATLRHRGGATLDRVVVHQDCGQVLQALALIGALLLDPGLSLDLTAEAKPAEMAAATATIPQSRESRAVVVAPSKPKTSTTRVARVPTVWVTGPFVGLTADEHIGRDLRFGPRLGWSLTNHALVGGAQLEVAVSVARVTSGTLDFERRQAEISWSSARVDACYGSSAHSISVLGGCAWFDLGQLTGSGRDATTSRTQRLVWSRFGAAIHGRQSVIGVLALDMKIGAMVAMSRPEFYFAEVNGLPEQTARRIPLVGLLADIALDLHLW